MHNHLTLAILTIVSTMWVRPKVTDIENLKLGLSEIKTKSEMLIDAKIVERLIIIETKKEAEQKELQTKIEVLQDSINRALHEVQLLQTRSEAEIKRIQAETVEQNQKGREEVIKIQAAERSRVAVEQAEQDVMLAEIGETLARLTPAQHELAKEKLKKAQVRLQQLVKFSRVA